MKSHQNICLFSIVVAITMSCNHSVKPQNQRNAPVAQNQTKDFSSADLSDSKQPDTSLPLSPPATTSFEQESFLVDAANITEPTVTSSNIRTYTWRFTGDLSINPNISRKDFMEGTRQGFAMINRYFNVNFVEKSGSGSAYLYVRIRNSIPANWPSWYLRTAWYEDLRYGPYRSINWGYQTEGNVETVRRTTMHEITHFFGLNLHNRQSELRGNRVVDIGGHNATWTQKDIQFLNTVGVYLRTDAVHPHEDSLWWTAPKPPIAVDDVFSVSENVEHRLDVLANDSDPNKDKLRIVSVDSDLAGQVRTDGEFIYYTPNLIESSIEVINYTISDQANTGGEISATVTVDVEITQPIAKDDVFSVAENIEHKLDVLANDSDPNNEKIHIVSVSSDLGGQVRTDGEFIYYTPNLLESAIEVITYTISNEDGTGGEISAKATVDVYITPRQEYSWSNPANPYDVNNDGQVTSLDSLNVINAIGKVELNKYVETKIFYDVNDDGSITSLDALAVINYISRNN